MPFLVPYAVVVPPAIVQGVRRLPAIDYTTPGRPASSLRFETLRAIQRGSTRKVDANKGVGNKVSALIRPAVAAELKAMKGRGGLHDARRPELKPPAAQARRMETGGAQCAGHCGKSNAVVRVYFATDSARLTVAEVKRLKALPAKGQYLVIGHADPRPVGVSRSFKLNLELSMRRAMAVAKVLVARGDRVSTEARSWLGANLRPAEYRFDRRASVYIARRPIRRLTEVTR